VSAAVVAGQMYEPMAELSARVGVFGHGYTYSGHPVSCAVASRVLDIYRRDRLFEHAATVGEYLQSRLNEFADHPLVGEVRGMGLIAALELVADRQTRQPFEGNAVGGFCQRRCEEYGLIVRALGGNSIALCPPLIITEAQVDELVEKLGRALEDTLSHVKTRGL
jgi:4-aminobutyrate--pyruvate transaminase